MRSAVMTCLLGRLPRRRIAFGNGAASAAAAATAAAAAAAATAIVASCRPKADDEWDAEVDYIVIGAGSAGCAAASRLASTLPGKQTLLLEAGWHDDLPQIQTAVDYFGKVEAVFASDRDWAYCAEPQAELNGRALCNGSCTRTFTP